MAMKRFTWRRLDRGSAENLRTRDRSLCQLFPSTGTVLPLEVPAIGNAEYEWSRGDISPLGDLTE